MLAIGMVLRKAIGWGPQQADVLNTLIVDVTMPALLFVALARDGVRWSAWQVLPATTTALLVCLALGFLVARALKLERPAQGSASLVASFSNTGFLGIPLLLAVYPRNPAAASSALMVDVMNTTFMLWTLGLAVSERLGRGAAFDVKSIARIFVKPMILAVIAGAIIHELDVKIPAFALDALDVLGHTTSPLVFLSLGLALDLRALRGRLLPVLLLSAIKIVVMPAIAFAVVKLLATSEPMASIAVLQSAMPSALATVIVAARAGCDRTLAAAVVALTTLISMASLPGWAAFIS